MATILKIRTATLRFIIRIIFFCCAFYFLLMGFSLIVIPEVLVRGVAGGSVNPAIIGMLRGAGGSIIPYSLLYILIALDPFRRYWAVYIILTANIAAIILDLGSVFTGEYNILNAMIDLPVEFISIIGITLLLIKVKEMRKAAGIQTSGILHSDT